MMRFVPLDPATLRLIPYAPAAAQFGADLARPGIAEKLVEFGAGWIALDGGYLIGAGGVLMLEPQRGRLWLAPSIFARPRHFARALPFARRWLLGLLIHHQFRRIEATTPASFAAGCRFLKHLGFACETPAPMRRFGADGSDHYLYALTDGIA